jgi:hypothetical protein
MDAKTLVKVLKQVVREEVRSVIKEELTEILQEGLQSTINEIANTKKPNIQETKQTKKKSVEFKKTSFADILNETDSLREQSPYGAAMNQTLNEDITMTSADVQSFGHVREKMRSQMMGITVPEVIADPETGRNMKVDPVVAKAMTRDYSALMKAMDKKKGKG